MFLILIAFNKVDDESFFNVTKIKWEKGRTSPSLEKKHNLKHKVPLIELAKRPNVILSELISEKSCPNYNQAATQLLIELRYEGYIKKQQAVIAKLKKWHHKAIPKHINFNTIKGLRNESRERLIEEKPQTFYEASKIAGINPADLSVLLLYLEKK